jgi:type I restriction enzyme S subunit
MKKAVLVKTLDDLVESGIVQLTRGKIISKRDMAAHPGTFPVYSSAKDNDGKFGEYGRFMFDEDLITWSVDGGGRLFFRPKHKFSVTNVGGVLRILDRSVLDYKYLYYALSLRHSEIKFDWVRKAHPSVIRKLYQNIPIPSLDEQRRIVGSLDEAFEGIATTKTNAGKNLQNVRALFESHLQSVFTRRGPGWAEKALFDVCEVEYGYTEKAKNSGDFRFVRITDTDDNGLLMAEGKMYIDSFADARKYLLVDGDLLMARTGASAGNVLLFEGSEKAVFASYLIRMRFKKEIVSKLYWYFSKSQLYWSQVRLLSAGAAQPQFNGGALKQIVFPYPESSAEQKTIISKFGALDKETQSLASIYERKLDSLEALKKSLLNEAFSGNL